MSEITEFPSELHKQLYKLYEEGLSYREIAKRIVNPKVSYQYVANKLNEIPNFKARSKKKMGLKRPSAAYKLERVKRGENIFNLKKAGSDFQAISEMTGLDTLEVENLYAYFLENKDSLNSLSGRLIRSSLSKKQHFQKSDFINYLSVSNKVSISEYCKKNKFDLDAFRSAYREFFKSYL